jgi:hypothetical protein
VVCQEESGAGVCLRNDDNGIEGFLYLKAEDGRVTDVSPEMPAQRRVRIGTLKVVPHGTRLGERLIKKAFDHALDAKAEEIYVTVFPKHQNLIDLISRYGFEKCGQKFSANGKEDVFVRALFRRTGDVLRDYPLIPIRAGRHFLIALYPEWHSRLLPDSILKNEDASILEDVSHTNSIHKIYLAKMEGVSNLRRGDTLVIYRTSDGAGPAHYRSVATSICVVEELHHIREFPTFESFYSYCAPYSIFSEEELTSLYNQRRYPWIIKFTYNLALRKRVTRQVLIEKVGLSASAYWGFMPMSTKQLQTIFDLGNTDKSTLFN